MADLVRYARDLMAAIPELHTYWTEDLPYMVFSAFGTFVRDRVSEYGISDCLVRKSFEYVNQSVDTTDDVEYRNLICVGVFEPLCDRSETVSAALALLTGDARRHFLNTLQWFGPKFLP